MVKIIVVSSAARPACKIWLLFTEDTCNDVEHGQARVRDGRGDEDERGEVDDGKDGHAVEDKLQKHIHQAHTRVFLNATCERGEDLAACTSSECVRNT